MPADNRNAASALSSLITKEAYYAVLEGQCLFCGSLLERNGYCDKEGISLAAHAAPMADGRPQVEVRIRFANREAVWGWNAEVGYYAYPSEVVA